ncbi:MAG: Fur-regulated basic protein FbpA [Heyndrickxia faecalis]|nr:Fur-regulated basic protein FbpA [Heyndrickxia coagulans]UXC23144.1 Fur-regulated basic protein FbpA [Heyndrickxia coagulans]
MIEQLIALGAYQEDDKQLFTLTLTELETEYAYFSKISQEKEASGRE